MREEVGILQEKGEKGAFPALCVSVFQECVYTLPEA